MNQQTDPNAANLEELIQRYVRNGFRVVSRTETTAQLVKPKRFSFWWFLFWFLCGGFPALIYVVYYLARSDKVEYLAPTGPVLHTYIKRP